MKEITHDENGQKIVKVSMAAMDAVQRGVADSFPKAPILHRPGEIPPVNPELEALNEKAFREHCGELGNRWLQGSSEQSAIPKVTGDPYEDRRRWLEIAWKEGK